MNARPDASTGNNHPARNAQRDESSDLLDGSFTPREAQVQNSHYKVLSTYLLPSNFGSIQRVTERDLGRDPSLYTSYNEQYRQAVVSTCLAADIAPQRVLLAGVGSNALEVLFFSAIFPRAEIVAIEPFDLYLNRLKQDLSGEIQNVRLKEESIQATTRDSGFDLIYCSGVISDTYILRQSREHQSFLENCRRLLTDRGLVMSFGLLPSNILEAEKAGLTVIHDRSACYKYPLHLLGRDAHPKHDRFFVPEAGWNSFTVGGWDADLAEKPLVRSAWTVRRVDDYSVMYPHAVFEGNGLKYEYPFGSGYLDKENDTVILHGPGTAAIWEIRIPSEGKISLRLKPAMREYLREPVKGSAQKLFHNYIARMPFFDLISDSPNNQQSRNRPLPESEAPDIQWVE